MPPSENGIAPEIDLSAYVERRPIKIGDRRFTVRTDISMPGLADLNRAMEVMGGALTGEAVTREARLDAEDRIWAAVEEICATADPPLDAPVREVFNATAALMFLNFLLGPAAESMKAATPTGTS